MSRKMTVAGCLALSLSVYSCGSNDVPVKPPPVEGRTEFALRPSGKGLILRVREPLMEAEVQALVGAQRIGFERVRVFTYLPHGSIEGSTPVALWEWELGGGLVKKY